MRRTQYLSEKGADKNMTKLHFSSSRRNKRFRHFSSHQLIFITTAVFLIFTNTAFGQSLEKTSYNELLTVAIASNQQKGTKPDQTQQVLSIISAGVQNASSNDIFALIQQNWPQVDPHAPLRVWPEMRANLVTEGKELERLLSIIKPLLRFCQLELRVRPLLFKSEVPVTAFIYPNVLIFSTRALSILNDTEVEAVAAHEICHLLGHTKFKAAVKDNDERAMRLLELFYDAGAAAIISKKGGDPSRLISGLSKMTNILEIEFQEYQRGTKHPTLKVRKNLIDALCHQFSQKREVTQNN